VAAQRLACRATERLYSGASGMHQPRTFITDHSPDGSSTSDRCTPLCSPPGPSPAPSASIVSVCYLGIVS
jgi:hypothetical protein